MEWETLRSWRDRDCWLPLAGALLLGTTVALCGNLWVRHYLHDLELLQASNPQAAAAAAERGLRVLGLAVCGFALASATVLARYCLLGLREQRLPPSGWWSLGARRAAVGPGARKLSLFGLGLSALLGAAGMGCLFAVWHLLEVLSVRPH